MKISIASQLDRGKKCWKTELVLYTYRNNWDMSEDKILAGKCSQVQDLNLSHASQFYIHAPYTTNMQWLEGVPVNLESM
jgi:hypothetical protein